METRNARQSPRYELFCGEHKISVLMKVFVDLRERSTTAFDYPLLPPTSDEVIVNMVDLGIRETVYRDPYYSNLKDAPKRSREYAGRMFHLKGGTGVGSLDEWAVMDDWWGDGDAEAESRWKGSPKKSRGDFGRDESTARYPLISKGVAGWEYAGGACPGPPSRRQIEEWLKETDGRLVDDAKAKRLALQSQVGMGLLSCLSDTSQLILSSVRRLSAQPRRTCMASA